MVTEWGSCVGLGLRCGGWREERQGEISEQLLLLRASRLGC